MRPEGKSGAMLVISCCLSLANEMREAVEPVLALPINGEGPEIPRANGWQALPVCARCLSLNIS